MLLPVTMMLYCYPVTLRWCTSLQAVHIIVILILVLCVTYLIIIVQTQSPRGQSHLLCGDDSGSVVILTFLKPVSGLFASANNKDDDERVMFIPYAVSVYALCLQIHTGHVLM